MATIQPQFKLKEPNSQGKAQVFLRVYYEGVRFTYYLGIRIKPEYWLSEEQRPVLSNKELEKGKLPVGAQFDHQNINNRLKRYSSETVRIYDHFRYQGVVPTPKNMKDELDKVFRQQEVEAKSPLLIPYIDHFIARNNNKYNTTRNYKTTRNHLDAFEKQRGRKIKLSEVNMDFYQELVRYFYGKGKSTNTIGTNIKNLKVFLADALDHDLEVSMDFTKKAFKVMEEETDAIYLTKTEIQRITDLDLADKPKLDRVRDLFLIGCHTGLRFSDYTQISKDHIMTNEKGTFLRVRMVKTGKSIVIPLKPEALKILDKNNWVMPRVPSNQKTNDYLKDIAKLAEFDDKVPIHRTKGNLRVETTPFKWKLVTTHTARRSFATNAYLEGLPILGIMMITGHTKEKSFMKYIRMSSEDNAIKMADYSFFSGQMKEAN